MLQLVVDCDVYFGVGDRCNCDVWGIVYVSVVEQVEQVGGCFGEVVDGVECSVVVDIVEFDVLFVWFGG